MFEKEAKERAKDYTENKERQVAYECGFLDGADRMKEEMQKLKEDNADLKQSLDWANERESEDCKRIAELEKENAELKADYKVLSCSVGDFEELQNKLEEEQRKNNILSDNLTKAKEIIQKLCDWVYGRSGGDLELLEQAEKFVKEE